MKTGLLYTNDKETINKLLEYGYPLLKTQDGTHIFANIDCNKLNFDELKIIHSNKMTF